MKIFLNISSGAFVVVGTILFCLGGLGIWFCYEMVSQEKITTPEDAPIPNSSLRGPLTLLAQSEAIRGHVLKMSEGRYYAEIPQTETGLRSTWITALTLITALNLGVLAYVFSGFVVLLGFFMVWIGIVILFLNRRLKF